MYSKGLQSSCFARLLIRADSWAFPSPDSEEEFGGWIVLKGTVYCELTVLECNTLLHCPVGKIVSYFERDPNWPSAVASEFAPFQKEASTQKFAGLAAPLPGPGEAGTGTPGGR